MTKSKNDEVKGTINGSNEVNDTNDKDRIEQNESVQQGNNQIRQIEKCEDTNDVKSDETFIIKTDDAHSSSGVVYNQSENRPEKQKRNCKLDKEPDDSLNDREKKQIVLGSEKKGKIYRRKSSGESYKGTLKVSDSVTVAIGSIRIRNNSFHGNQILSDNSNNNNSKTLRRNKHSFKNVSFKQDRKEGENLKSDMLKFKVLSPSQTRVEKVTIVPDIHTDGANLATDPVSRCQKQISKGRNTKENNKTIEGKRKTKSLENGSKHSKLNNNDIDSEIYESLTRLDNVVKSAEQKSDPLLKKPAKVVQNGDCLHTYVTIKQKVDIADVNCSNFSKTKKDSKNLEPGNLELEQGSRSHFDKSNNVDIVKPQGGCMGLKKTKSITISDKYDSVSSLGDVIEIVEGKAKQNENLEAKLSPKDNLIKSKSNSNLHEKSRQNLVGNTKPNNNVEVVKSPGGCAPPLYDTLKRTLGVGAESESDGYTTDEPGYVFAVTAMPARYNGTIGGRRLTNGVVSDILPGTLPTNDTTADNRASLPAHVTTTELGHHSVSQKGAPRGDAPPPLAQKPTNQQPARPLSAGVPGGSNGTQREPPVRASQAWLANVTPTRSRPNQAVIGQRDSRQTTISQQQQGRSNTAFEYDEGELLMPPPPKHTDTSLDESMDNPAAIIDHDIGGYKYEPSRPSERSRYGSNPPGGQYKPPPPPPLPPKYQPPPQYSPHPTTRMPHGEPTQNGSVANNDLRNACNKIYGRPPQPSPPYPGGKPPAPYPSSPYLSRASPMGQSSSSPPSHSSSGASSSQSPPDTRLNGVGDTRLNTNSESRLNNPNTDTRGLNGAMNNLRLNSASDGQWQSKNRYPPPAPPSGQSLELQQMSSAQQNGSGESRHSSQERFSNVDSRSGSQDRFYPGSATSLNNGHSALGSQERFESRTTATNPPSRPQSGDYRSRTQEPRPKTPIGSAGDVRTGDVGYSRSGEILDKHNNRPKTPTVTVNGGYEHGGRIPGHMTTSTPKQQLSDPYTQQRGTFTQQQQQQQQQMQQQRMLQSSSMVPSSVATSGGNSHKQTLSLDPAAWNHSYSDISSQRSITPPLPPLSPGNTPPITPPDSPPPHTRGSHSRPDVVASTKRSPGNRGKKSSARPGAPVSFRTWDGRSKRSTKPGHPRTAALSKARNRNSVDTVSESQMSDDFVDGEEEVTTNASATEDEIDGHEVSIIRQQLEGLETMYTEILKVLGIDREYMMTGSRRSVSSMSSMSRTPGGRRRRSTHNHRQSRELKKVNQRFQRLESHVVTLARSVAHLSSEMRQQNSLFQDVEEIKADIVELKKMRSAVERSANGGPRISTAEFERFRGWVPSLTNPKRVQKLKKFFGADPPLLHIFLKKLGYERYATNFDHEGITMVELPYLNEERLQKIGIPMGPRLRILQESQMCFRQDNFDIYIV